MTEAEWLAGMMRTHGYPDGKLLPDGRYVVIVPRIFTTALAVGRVYDDHVYNDSWCYDSPLAAVAAMQVWDGEGEPQGWIRHPRTGRRVSRSADEVDDHGKRVGAVGVLYFRA